VSGGPPWLERLYNEGSVGLINLIKVDQYTNENILQRTFYDLKFHIFGFGVQFELSQK
jgi:hypothetical protein